MPLYLLAQMRLVGRAAQQQDAIVACDEDQCARNDRVALALETDVDALIVFGHEA